MCAMPTVFWASAGLMALAGCGSPVCSARAANRASDSRSVGASQSPAPAKERAEVRSASGVSHLVTLEVDGTVAPGSEPLEVEVVGEVEGTLLLVDTYSSMPGGMSYCQAGEERFLRIVSLASSQPTETARFKLSSCRQNIELGSPGLEWHPESSTLHVQWLAGPATPSTPAELTLRIGSS